MKIDRGKGIGKPTSSLSRPLITGGSVNVHKSFSSASRASLGLLNGSIDLRLGFLVELLQLLRHQPPVFDILL